MQVSRAVEVEGVLEGRGLDYYFLFALLTRFELGCSNFDGMCRTIRAACTHGTISADVRRRCAGANANIKYG